MEIIPYDLTFPSGVHVGTRGVNLEETQAGIPSDTLFAALVDTWRRLGESPDEFAAPFVAEPPEPPFLLSSAFPFAGEVRFFPAPVNLAHYFAPETVKARAKDIKRIQFLSEALFRKVLQRERLDEWLFPPDAFAEPERGVALQGGRLWLTLEEVTGLPAPLQRRKGQYHALRRLSVWASTRVPRVTVDRISSTSTIFHAGRTTFSPGCGLWFGVVWLDPERRIGEIPFREAWARAFRTLAEDGIGGERSVGYGIFEWREGTPFVLPETTPNRPAVLLSRYHPRPEELPQALNGENVAYRLTSVAGWLRSPDGAAQRRKRVYLLDAGSTIAWPGLPAGNVVDVRPDYPAAEGSLPHPVYRYGLALATGQAGR